MLAAITTTMFAFLLTNSESTEAHLFIPSWSGLNLAQLSQSTTTTEDNAHHTCKHRWSSTCMRGTRFQRHQDQRQPRISCISNGILPIPSNIADADNHVAKVEQSIQIIKERTRCLVQGLPYKRIAKALMRAAIKNANKVLKLFPA
jgi:hypothetical protein